MTNAYDWDRYFITQCIHSESHLSAPVLFLLFSICQLNVRNAGLDIIPSPDTLIPFPQRKQPPHSLELQKTLKSFTPVLVRIRSSMTNTSFDSYGACVVRQPAVKFFSFCLRRVGGHTFLHFVF